VAIKPLNENSTTIFKRRKQEKISKPFALSSESPHG
jgi:hypothetical protein